MSEAVTRLNAALEGSYRIESKLGEGGMATVYLANDLKHERRVALKVLKPELAAVLGADRFLAEIKTTANLQHPHILPLHDSGEADRFLYYVMPYVEGETLRNRIDRDKQLPVDEALGIATAVANALHTAHMQGVVHRDIKPGNILMSQGQPLVADFGIALAVNAGGSGRLTETGLSLGTPYYMSPEQATGDQVVGPASDTFALACVLYEMLVGEPPYPGTTAQAVLGKIIQGLPVSATAVRRSVPANVDAAIRKALEKLPADRFSNAQAFAKALADPGFRHGEADAGGGAAGGLWNRLSMAATVAATVFALTTAWALLRPGPPPPVPNVERFAVPFLEGQEPSASWSGSFALSPDGTMVVYRRGSVLMVRRWDDLTATPLRESQGAFLQQVSPDGGQVAFSSAAGVKVAAFSGGPVRTLISGRLSVWGRDDYLYAQADSGAVRIPPEGGTPEYVSRLAEGDRTHWVDDVLPGGQGALLGVELEGGIDEIRTLNLRNGEMTPLMPGSRAKYVPSGHLVYRADDGTMMAARFDPDRMELLGTPVAVLDGVQAWSLADDGKLFYSAGSGSTTTEQQLMWVSRSGQESAVDPEWTFARGDDSGNGLSLSPDGSTVAVRAFSQGGYDIWLKRLDDGTYSRLTFDEAHEKMPVWEPGGERVTYLSDRNGNFDVWSSRADGTGQPELVLDVDVDLHRVDWSPDGEWILLWTADDDILAYRPDGDEEPLALLAESYEERDPAVSPDGRWIAYVSNETGVNQTYVRPFPDVTGGKWQVSVRAARYPRWGHSGRELYYQDSGSSPSMWVVEIDATDAFRFGSPNLLFDAPNGWVGSAQFAEPYDVSGDDERLILPVYATSDTGGATGPRLVLVNNFTEELKRVVRE